MAEFPFEINAVDGKARTGVLRTSRGPIRTPAFMPVGTAGTVKALTMDQVKGAGSDIILGNTYHLMLRPGAERVRDLGGLHKFSTWAGPILTDSGGFQVFSLSQLAKKSENGMIFQSHIDGSRYELTPERSIEIQADLLGADISMQFDECTEHPVSHADAKTSMELSLRWGARSKAAFGERETQNLFGIVQGSTYRDLREQSAAGLIEQGFDGYAIGGLAVGEGFEKMCEVLDYTPDFLPADRPRYLMGVGRPLDIIEAVARGVDMFDCVMPTRAGRHGQAWSDYGSFNLKNARFRDDAEPLLAEIDCPASQDYSRAYIHHLVKCGETLGAILLSWHNIAYYQSLMMRIRSAIADGSFEDLRRELHEKTAAGLP
ncbi:MAG: tRNA guanosine(34) transglycosylase Tgt [Robiginitomaculum sp.]|nr:MAG: tRNA guanosine(34) transglycosylase Tgt [Robiginitomaculum sp.]